MARPIPPPAGGSDQQREPAAGAAGTGAPRRRVPPEPLADDPLTATDIDEINKNSPFQPVFFALDSSEVDGRRSRR